jgi:hypothetical protein
MSILLHVLVPASASASALGCKKGSVIRRKLSVYFWTSNWISLKCVRLVLVFLPQDISSSEAFTGPGYCIVTDLVIMAMQDLVFAHVPNFDVLQQMMQNAEGVIRLQYKPGCSEMAVLRAYTDGQSTLFHRTKLSNILLYINSMSSLARQPVSKVCPRNNLIISWANFYQANLAHTVSAGWLPTIWRRHHR